jgi:hypothetical protein
MRGADIKLFGEIPGGECASAIGCRVVTMSYMRASPWGVFVCGFASMTSSIRTEQTSTIEIRAPDCSMHTSMPMKHVTDLALRFQGYAYAPNYSVQRSVQTTRQNTSTVNSIHAPLSSRCASFVVHPKTLIR